MKEEIKLCQNCGERVVGRSDKKFCSDECRTMFHNQRYRDTFREISKINRILKKNYAIIDTLYKKGERQTSLTALFGMGFNFEFFTSLRKSTDSEDSFITGCYNYNYTISRNGSVSISETQ